MRAARTMGDALADRAVRDAAGARWQFIEYRQDPPLLPPGTAWMQGAAGIAAFLIRLARVVETRPGRRSWSTARTNGGPYRHTSAISTAVRPRTDGHTTPKPASIGTSACRSSRRDRRPSRGSLNQVVVRRRRRPTSQRSAA